MLFENRAVAVGCVVVFSLLLRCLSCVLFFVPGMYLKMICRGDGVATRMTLRALQYLNDRFHVKRVKVSRMRGKGPGFHKLYTKYKFRRCKPANNQTLSRCKAGQ